MHRSENDLLDLGDFALSVDFNACKRCLQIFITLLFALLQHLANIFRKMVEHRGDDIVLVDFNVGAHLIWDRLNWSL